MFFHKERFCEKCHISIAKKEMCTFDYSLQGRNKEGNKIHLCQSCAREELIENFREHTQKAVIIPPDSKYDAYVFYSFQALIDGEKHSINKEITLKSIYNIKSFLPKENEKCSCCSNHAKYTWCTLDIFDNAIPWNLDINLAEKENCIHLCKACFLDCLNKSISNKSLILRAIYPMINEEEGYYTPWMS